MTVVFVFKCFIYITLSFFGEGVTAAVYYQKTGQKVFYIDKALGKCYIKSSIIINNSASVFSATTISGGRCEKTGFIFSEIGG